MGLLCCGLWTTLAHGIGCIVLCKFLYEVYMFINACFFRPGKDLKREYGEWAIVTGATDGIGKAMAQQLAKGGQKVILVSRSEDKLAACLKEMPGSGHATFAIDFGKFGPDLRAKFAAFIKGKDIGVVVNNVGMSYDHAAYFHELDPESIEQLVKLNIDSTNYMCHMVLPGMLEKKQGAIVNLSSGLALWSCPLYAGYSAAKEYVRSLSLSIGAEYASKGIDVQVQYPAFVTTKMAKLRKTTWTTPCPEEYAKAAVKAIGYEREISPFWAHYLLCGIMRSLPMPLQDLVCNAMHKPIRAKALQKKAKAAEEGAAAEKRPSEKKAE